MESDGIVMRKAFVEIPSRVVYSLSELGNSLRPIMEALQDWGEGYKALKL